MHRRLLPRLDNSRHWLVADIGGTNARLACIDANREVSARRTLRNDAFPNIEDLLQAFRADLAEPPSQMLLALALPVTEDTLKFTNRPWTVSAPELGRRFGLDTVVIVNDFVAAAAGTADPAAISFETVREGTPRPGARVVLGPGTGLGVAGVIENDCAVGDGSAVPPPRVVESEAGHMTFAAEDDESLRVLRAAQARWGRVSWERILSGSGLAWLDAFWRGSEVEEPPPRVVMRARAGDADARAAIGWFSRALGVFAGDVCLALRAFGGVTLTGGVLKGIGDLFDHERFQAAFVAKGRFANALASVPCARAIVEDLALAGLTNIVHGRAAVPGIYWKRGED